MSDAYLLAGLSNPTLWIALGVVVIGGIMRGFAGFGSAMLFAPIFSVLMSPAHMVPLVVSLELPMGLLLAWESRRRAEWRFVIGMALAALVGMPIGIWLLVSVDSRALTIGISIAILFFVLVLMSGWRYRGPRPWPLTAGIGAASGVMMATSSVGGPPVLLYMLAAEHPAATIRANIVTYFGLTIFVLIAMVYVASPTALGALIDAAILAPAMLVGVWIGMRLAGRASDRIYRGISYAFITCAAVIGLVG